MKRVILTGGTGFVGANLARRLLRDGHEVHLLVRPNYQPWRIDGIRSDVRLHELHLHDAEAVARVVSEIRPEWVFHLAVHGAYSWQTDWEQMVRTNIQGTMSLVFACLETVFEALVNTGYASFLLTLSQSKELIRSLTFTICWWLPVCPNGPQ